MDKYEYRLKAEQIEKLVKKKDYKTAAKIADTIDWRRVKNLNILYIVSEIYECMERYEDCMEILNIAYDRAPVGRMLLYKMTEIATKMHNFEEAIGLYREFVKSAPHDQSRYILKYQIYRERGSSLEDQIKILRDYKSHEYQEKWAYELASLYAEAGYTEDCVKECDELILWFSEGEYVIKAMELKMQFEPLTAAQQEKYDHRFGDSRGASVHEDDFEETEVEFSADKFNTMNLQAELAANLGELLNEEADVDIPMLNVETEEEELDMPEVSLEELRIPEEPEVSLEELRIPEEPEVSLEELRIPEEPEVSLEELRIPEEAGREEELVEKQITGQMTIDDILAEWENKKAETEAILEANAPQVQVRKEKVKQETAELMKLISGGSETLPQEVQHILDEIDQEKRERQPFVTEDDLPKDLDVPEETGDEEEISFEDLDTSEEPVAVKQERVSQDTTSMNMIQELERFLAAEVSEMAVNAGHLTKDQARLFAYFTSVKGMSQQLSVLFKGEPHMGRSNSSSGNLVVTGQPGNGKTTLAIDIVKALQRQKRIEGKRLAKISGQKLNSKDICEVLSKLKGGALIIEGAGSLSDASMMALSLAMEGDTGGLLIILEDSAEEIQRIFHKNKNFASKFDHTIDIPTFTNDELVAFGKSYALEADYVFDEFGILALYDRIGCRQTNDHMVTVAEVKDMIDGAIAHAEKGSVRHLFEKMTKKNVDEFGNHLLREDDFESV